MCGQILNVYRFNTADGEPGNCRSEYSTFGSLTYWNVSGKKGTVFKKEKKGTRSKKSEGIERLFRKHGRWFKNIDSVVKKWR